MRAIVPVIATLLLVAIAVVGGSIVFVFSQTYFQNFYQNEYDIEKFQKKYDKLECYNIEFDKRPVDILIYEDLDEKFMQEYDVERGELTYWMEKNDVTTDLIERCNRIVIQDTNVTRQQIAPSVYSEKYGSESIIDLGFESIQMYVATYHPYNQIKSDFSTLEEASSFYFMNDYEFFMSAMDFSECKTYEYVNNDGDTETFSYLDCDLYDRQFFYNFDKSKLMDKKTYTDEHCLFMIDLNMFDCKDDVTGKRFLIGVY